MPEAPSYLYINPDDGCVKIMPWFNLAYLNPPVIQYKVFIFHRILSIILLISSYLTYISKVGVFNPENTDCISITQRQCTITIENALKKELKCVNKLTIIGNFILDLLKFQIYMSIRITQYFRFWHICQIRRLFTRSRFDSKLYNHTRRKDDI
jgi:hypothetical protein